MKLIREPARGAQGRVRWSTTSELSRREGSGIFRKCVQAQKSSVERCDSNESLLSLNEFVSSVRNFSAVLCACGDQFSVSVVTPDFCVPLPPTACHFVAGGTDAKVEEKNMHLVQFWSLRQKKRVTGKLLPVQKQYLSSSVKINSNAGRVGKLLNGRKSANVSSMQRQASIGSPVTFENLHVQMFLSDDQQPVLPCSTLTHHYSQQLILAKFCDTSVAFSLA